MEVFIWKDDLVGLTAGILRVVLVLSESCHTVLLEVILVSTFLELKVSTDKWCLNYLILYLE